MQHTPRLHKVKNRNNQIQNPYNNGVHFLSTPNDTQISRTQVNQKIFNNVGQINEASVLQYHRAPNFQIKNSNQEVRYFPNRRNQQPIFFKAPHYQNHLNVNFQQSFQLNNSLVKKIPKDQQNASPTCVSNIHLQYKEKDLVNTEQAGEVKEANNEECLTKLYNKKNPKLRKIKSDVPNNEKEKILLNNGAENPSILHISGTKERYKECNKESNENQIEPEIKINNADSDISHFEESNEKSVKGTREKTPMCLINDLARFNKISFQYRLTSENGPAHCKRFTVTLKLGDEEYTAEGFKIKKAQHLAAKEAIAKTKYKHPIPKTNRNDDTNSVKTNITPTVELNALAMKLGQQTYYIFDPSQMDISQKTTSQNNSLKTNFRLIPKQIESTNINQPTTLMIDNLSKTFTSNIMNNGGKQIQPLTQKANFFSKCQNVLPFHSGIQSAPACKMNSLVSTYFPATSPCKITLIVGTRKFEGVGRTLQQAKHNAASNALQVLKEHINSDQKDEEQNESIDDNDNKSPISQVFEIGIKRNLHVDFKVLREEGPAHMRTFVTACIVGDLITEGEGTGKKISKKRAAQKMLEELAKLPPIMSIATPVKKVKLKTTSKKCESAQSKVFPLVANSTKDETERQWNKNKKKNCETESTNPITKLLEWHQNRKEKEPVFKLINEGTKENTRRRQFVMEVSSNNIIARGVGPNKKVAKRDAAQNFLIAVNEKDEVHSISKDNYNSNTCYSTENKLCKEKVKSDGGPDEDCNSLVDSHETYQVQLKGKDTSFNSFQLLKTKETDPTNSKKTSSKTINLHMKDQLLYLAKLLGFEVEFSDYPKGNHNEFLSIVMLSTSPPQICHGVGIDARESQEDASRNALKILSEMGLNNAVKS